MVGWLVYHKGKRVFLNTSLPQPQLQCASALFISTQDAFNFIQEMLGSSGQTGMVSFVISSRARSDLRHCSDDPAADIVFKVMVLMASLMCDQLAFGSFLHCAANASFSCDCPKPTWSPRQDSKDAGRFVNSAAESPARDSTAQFDSL